MARKVPVYNVATGEMVEMWQLDAVAAVSKHPDEWSMTPAKKAAKAPAEVVPAAGAAAKTEVTDSPPPPLVEAAAPQTAGDDLTVIKGIGPGTVRQLAAAGVTTFADLADWEPGEIHAFETEHRMVGRVAREEWQEQAAALAAEAD